MYGGLGLLTALVCMYRQRCSRGFAVTLAILPAMVQMVILLVNGNIGAGVAVAGAFSLVRFRSVPGTAREIGAIFLAWPSALPQAWAMWPGGHLLRHRGGGAGDALPHGRGGIAAEAVGLRRQ